MKSSRPAYAQEAPYARTRRRHAPRARFTGTELRRHVHEEERLLRRILVTLRETSARLESGLTRFDDLIRERTRRYESGSQISNELGLDTETPSAEATLEEALSVPPASSQNISLPTEEKSNTLLESLAEELTNRLYCSSYLCHEDVHDSRGNSPLFYQWMEALRSSGKTVYVENEPERNVDEQDVIHLLEDGWLLHIPTHTLVRGRKTQDVKKEDTSPT